MSFSLAAFATSPSLNLAKHYYLIYPIRLNRDKVKATTHPFGWRSGKVGVGGCKSERIENILISLIFVWLGVEKWKDKKMNLNKFTHMLLLKNYT